MRPYHGLIFGENAHGGIKFPSGMGEKRLVLVGGRREGLVGTGLRSYGIKGGERRIQDSPNFGGFEDGHGTLKRHRSNALSVLAHVRD